MNLTPKGQLQTPSIIICEKYLKFREKHFSAPKNVKREAQVGGGILEYLVQTRIKYSYKKAVFRS